MFPFNLEDDDEWEDLDLSNISSNMFLRSPK